MTNKKNNNAQQTNKQKTTSTLTDNPLACDCGAKWIQKQIEEDESVLGPEKDNINCTDVETGESKSLSAVDIVGCGK